MQVVVFPISIEPERINLMGSEINGNISPVARTRETIIGGYKLKSVEANACWPFSEYLQGRVYLMSNGEVTVSLTEYLKDGSEPKWWEGHITWKVPQKSDKPLAERLKQFENFLNSEMMRENFILDFTDTGKTLELNAHFIDGRKLKDIGYDKMKKAMQMSFAVFSVFKEYADKQYDIYVKLIENNGESTNGFEFSWSEYSIWEEPVLDNAIGG